ncbi:hypothetical protein [Streptomyces sp. ISL-10]|uniref:hypothetical protein n=1 Tax=Streptomyces sp. ISL-10 TaxID=2819172 RepID=UPI0020354473|nr:hypothetical protein [Streptomyces sp. ISL-10]
MPLGTIGYWKHGDHAKRVPGLIEACVQAMQSVLPCNRATKVRREGCIEVEISSKHLGCPFPQHGPGKKHELPITLEPWQQQIVDMHPWPFIRGLVHSDGSRITNRTEKVIGGQRKRYEYPRYFFTNSSADIIRLYTDALDRGRRVEGRQPVADAQNISVARRASVALMDAPVGPKHSCLTRGSRRCGAPGPGSSSRRLPAGTRP